MVNRGSRQMLSSVVPAALLALLMLASRAGPALGIEQTFTYLSIQSGSQDPSASSGVFANKGRYFETLESAHGKLKKDRLVRPEVFAFDFYSVSGSLAGGFGIEVHRYNRQFQFADDSQVDIYAVGVLYGFNFYYRGEIWFPFIGFGTGNYSAKVQEQLNFTGSVTKSTVFGQVDSPFYYKLGFRIPFNSWGLMLTQQYISADMEVATENKPLSLGGTATLFGAYYGF